MDFVIISVVLFIALWLMLVLQYEVLKYFEQDDAQDDEQDDEQDKELGGQVNYTSIHDLFSDWSSDDFEGEPLYLTPRIRQYRKQRNTVKRRRNRRTK